MSEKKIPSLKKLAQYLLVLLLSFAAGLALPHSVFAQDTPPSVYPPALVQSWKDYMKNYPNILAQYQKQQEEARKTAKPVQASEEKNMDDLMKTYPFLQSDLQSAKDIQEKIASSLSKNPDPSQKQSLDPKPHLQISESKDSDTGINLFFLGKSGPLWCSPHGCPMEVYVNTGAGYQKAGSFIVANDIYLARIGKNVFLFAGSPQKAGTVAWVLKDNRFVESAPPSSEPQSQAFVAWRDALKKAGHWPPPP